MPKRFTTLSIYVSFVLVYSLLAQRTFAVDVETNGNLTVNGVIESTTGGIKFPDDSIQTKACSACAYGVLDISLGGTGGSTESAARTSLGVPGLTTPNIFSASQTIQGDVSISGNLILPATTATAGIIKSGSSTLIHTYGELNFFAGYGAGNLSMTGNSNTASGYMALYLNTSGSSNTAHGNVALYSNTTGYGNTAIGSAALDYNTTGNSNTGSGSQTLWRNTTGSDNTASGAAALFWNTTGYGNTADGRGALGANTTGFHNTALGYAAGDSRQTGSSNTFIGANSDAGADGLTNATAIGANALVSQSDSLVLGASGVKVGIGIAAPVDVLDVMGNIRINDNDLKLRGNNGDNGHGLGWYSSLERVFDSTNSDRTPDGPVLYGYSGGALGTTNGGQKVAMKWSTGGFDFYNFVRARTLNTGSIPVCLDGNNTLSACSSDARMKKDVVTVSDKMNVLEALSKLRGVLFTWDRTNPKAANMFDGRDMGMIAQEVETVFPEIVHTDKDGYKSMDYPKLVAFLVEVNKAQQEQLVARKTDIDRLSRTVEELAARLSALEEKL